MCMFHQGNCHRCCRCYYAHFFALFYLISTIRIANANSKRHTHTHKRKKTNAHTKLNCNNCVSGVRLVTRCIRWRCVNTMEIDMEWENGRQYTWWNKREGKKSTYHNSLENSTENVYAFYRRRTKNHVATLIFIFIMWTLQFCVLHLNCECAVFVANVRCPMFCNFITAFGIW